MLFRSKSVELIIVTKNHPSELVLDLLDLGESQFGENKDQEASLKALTVAEAKTSNKPFWHFVGQLQSNKVRSMLNYASVLHSLDRTSLLKELAKQLAKEPSKKLQVFIELNLTDDPGRGGVSPDNLLAFAEEVLAVADADHAGAVRRPDRSGAGLGHRAFYLHTFLGLFARPRPISPLPRQCCSADRGRPHRGRRAGRALHAQEA